MNFFVIGLPRSRTAWLANFLTYEKHCFHEGLEGCRNLDDYRQKIGTECGDSSTALMLMDINKEFPRAPVVIIDSDIEKAIDYTYKTYGLYDPNYLHFLNNRLQDIAGMHVPFDAIDENLPAIWKYLIGTEYDEKRGDLLKKLRIEVKNPFYADRSAMTSLWNSLSSNWK